VKTLLLLVLGVLAPAWASLTWIRDRNAAVAAGRAAYLGADHPRAAKAFSTALAARARRVPDSYLVLNLAHAQLRSGQTAAAQASYRRLLGHSPATVGSIARQQLAVLAAQQGQLAPALALLRQALRLNPANAGARYDFEVLSDYLARQQDEPELNPPGTAPSASPKPKAKDRNAAEKTQPAEKAGTDQAGEVAKPNPANGAPQAPPQARPDAAGQPDNQRPAPAPGNTAKGSFKPGAGSPNPIASGTGPGAEQGLDRTGTAGTPAPTGRSNRPGSDAATPADLRLQTQRERLRAMNLSPGQARQLLEALRAQEQQYLQQVKRPAQQKPKPNEPTW
jgi:tetratricopeptide (TPR) repeat protein